MKNIKLLFLILVLTSLFACEKEMMDYEGKDSVYFKVQPPTITEFGDPEFWPLVDTSILALTKTLEDDSTYRIKVRLLGRIANYDRIFNISVDTTSTVKEGEDFDKLEKSYTMKAGERDAYISVTFHKTDRMKTENLFLTLNLEESADLSIDMPVWYSNEGQGDKDKKINVASHTINVSNKAYRPTIWFDSYAGPYSDAKILLVCNLYNITIDQFDNNKTMSLARFQAIFRAFKNYLLERELAGNPVYETDIYGNIILDSKGEKVKMKVGVSA